MTRGSQLLRPRPATPLPAPWLAPPDSTAQRVERLDGIAERIRAHVLFMGGIGALRGASQESKDRAVAASFDCIAGCDACLGELRRRLRVGAKLSRRQ